MSIALDHIVILVSPKVLADLPHWLTSSFSILDGGRHSNGITENKLILFRDGVYIELIAFVQGTSPEKRASTRWGNRSEGEVVDFALTLLQPEQTGDNPFDPEDVFRTTIQTRVRKSRAELEYSDPVAGGRVTPDGTELRWAVSVPAWVTPPQPVEGELPFWCLDRTSRDLRVPIRTRGHVVQHACGALGVRCVEVCIDGEDRAEKLRAVYACFLEDGNDIEGQDAGHPFPESSWELQVPAKVLPATSILTLRDARQTQVRQESSARRAINVGSESSNTKGLPRISLTLFTSGTPGAVSGEIAPGRVLEIQLVKA